MNGPTAFNPLVQEHTVNYTINYTKANSGGNVGAINTQQGWVTTPASVNTPHSLQGLILLDNHILAIGKRAAVAFHCGTPQYVSGLEVHVRQAPKAMNSSDASTTKAAHPKAVPSSASPVFELRDTDGARLLTSASNGRRIYLIGRHKMCDIQVNDSKMSLFHAAILMTPGGVRFVDLDSRNGTTLNGYRAHSMLISSSASLRCGSTWFSISKRAKDAGWLEFSSSAMQSVYRDCDRLASSDTAVLIQGETGSGKEHVARRLHEQSGRTGPFVVINSGTLSNNLAGSELFGHLAGSFTGAQYTRVGAFSQASGGTLFLDEIADLETQVQAQLLRAVETGEYKPVGGNELRSSTARIVCASHKNLLQGVANGSFRADLYHRLSGLTIDVPPLRDRPDDMDTLIDLELADLPMPRSLSKRARDRLHNYRWSGNIRELKTAVRRAAYRSDDMLIRAADIQLRPVESSISESSITLLRRAVRCAYAEHGDDTVKTSKALGMRRKRVQEFLGNPEQQHAALR